MTENEDKNKIWDEIDSIVLTVTDIHRSDYITHAINVIINNITILSPKEIVLAMKTLFFIGTLDPSVLEGHPTFSIEGPARTLWNLEDHINIESVIDELKIISTDLTKEILNELEDFKEGIFDGFGI